MPNTILAICDACWKADGKEREDLAMRPLEFAHCVICGREVGDSGHITHLKAWGKPLPKWKKTDAGANDYCADVSYDVYCECGRKVQLTNERLQRCECCKVYRLVISVRVEEQVQEVANA